MADGYIISGDGLIANKNTLSAESLTWPPAPIGYNGNSYVADFKIITGSLFLAVFKKIVPIPGSPPYFTELDSSNHPSAEGAASAFYPDSGGNTIYFAYTTGNAQPIIIQTFNLDTETWGSVVSSSGPTPSQRDAFRFVHRTNGDWVVAYNSTTGAEVLDVWWSKYDGSWSTPVRVSTVSSVGNDSASIADICLKESTGDVLFNWIQTLFSEGYTPNHLYATVLSSSDALGAAFNWLSTTQGSTWETSGRIVYNPQQDEWQFPGVFKNSTNSFYNTYGLMSISPASAPTTATQTNIIAANDGVNNVSFPRLAVDITASRLYFLWANNFDGNDGSPELLIISRPLDNGTPFPVTHSLDSFGGDVWTPNGMIYDANISTFQIDTTLDGTVLYDAGVDALHPVPDADVSVPFMDLTTFSVQDGTFRAANNPLCAYQYYYEFAAGLTISCPVLNTGTIDEFFSTTATASGGTPPYTYSITSGSLPPGITMTQDGTTATFSGTPLSAGSFSSTLTVTDSLGATASVDAPCPLTIANVPPPPFCELVPVPPSPELIAYNEPLERTGS